MAERPRSDDEAYAGSGSRPSTFEDAGLVERVNRGETEAYAELVRKYQDRIFNACWRICGNLEDARDITQEAFLKAYEGLSGFRGQSGFYTWLYRVAINLALSHRRSAGRRRTVSLDQVTEASGTQAEDLARRFRGNDDDDATRAVDEAERLGAAARALQALDDGHRAVVVLRDIEGFDYQEISVILEIPPGTVKSRLHRARLALRSAIVRALPSESGSV